MRPSSCAPFSGRDGLVPAVAHLDEREPPRPAGLPVHDELHLGHGPVLGEQLPELVLGGRERHVADVQILRHRVSLQNNREKAASAVFGGRQNARRTEYSVPGACDKPHHNLARKTDVCPPSQFSVRELNRNATRMAWPMHRPVMRLRPVSSAGYDRFAVRFPWYRSMRPFVITAAIFAGISLPQMETRAEPDFDKDVAPLLARRCLECHTGADPKGDLDLTRKDVGDRQGRAGRARANRRTASCGSRWPPTRCRRRSRSTRRRKALLKAWIAGGAKWGTDPIDPFAATTDNRAGRDWWSLQPVTRPDRSRTAAVPIRSTPSSGRSSSDHEAGHRRRPPTAARSSAASTSTCIGLPPTSEEVEAFAKDTSPDAYEKLVDSLLAVAALRRALGPLLARRRPLRRDERLRARPGEAERLEVSRLGHPRLQRRHAVRPLRASSSSPATSCPTAREQTVIATGFLRLGTWNDEPNDPQRVQVRPARRHGRRDQHRVPRPDGEVRPLPRPQVRPDPADRLLPHGRGVLGRARSSPGRANCSAGRTRRRSGRRTSSAGPTAAATCRRCTC